MIDPSFDTATMESPGRFLERSELEAKIADLENKLSLKTQQWEYASQALQKRNAQIESFEYELKHNSWNFDYSTLSDLASYFDIMLDREYGVTITVTFSGTVSVPMDYDMDDLENDLQASIDTHHYGNSDVIIDFMEDSMEIDYQEF
jgi:hypothetical protein